MPEEKKSLLRNKWLYIAILAFVVLGATFGGGAGSPGAVRDPFRPSLTRT